MFVFVVADLSTMSTKPPALSSSPPTASAVPPRVSPTSAAHKAADAEADESQGGMWYGGVEDTVEEGAEDSALTAASGAGKPRWDAGPQDAGETGAGQAEGRKLESRDGKRSRIGSADAARRAGRGC